MAQEKPKAEKSAIKETKETKKHGETIAHFVFAFADESRVFKTRDEMATAILGKFKAIGQTHTIKGKELTLANVGTLISALTKDVVTQRKGKWSGYKVVKDDETGFQLAKR